MERLTVLCRPARESDTADMLELTKTIWEGHDYVPQVWEDWLADRNGRLTVAEYDGQVIGFGKLSRISDEDWWLQGLRVHPEYQGRGVASQLHESLVQDWQKIGRGALRLATASFRYPVHRLCDRLGFEKIGEYSYFVAPAITGASPQSMNFEPLSLDQAEEAASFAVHSPSLASMNGLMDLRWEWAPPRRQYLSKVIEHGQAWWWRGKQGLLAVYSDQDEDEPPQPFVSLLICAAEQASDLLLDYRRLAASLGFQQAAWNAPLHAGWLAVLEATGFVREWDDALYIYSHKDRSNSFQ